MTTPDGAGWSDVLPPPERRRMGGRRARKDFVNVGAPIAVNQPRRSTVSQSAANSPITPAISMTSPMVASAWKAA